MSANDGKEAEAAFVDHWMKVGHVERFRDKRDLVGLNKGAKLADFAKPADFIVSSPTENLHYAEVKSTMDGKKFSFNKIQPGQNAAALQEARRGSGHYMFYIFSYATGKWYVMPCADYARRVDQGARSVKLEELSLWYK